MSSSFFSCFLCLCVFVKLISADPCPFNKDCDCTKGASPDPLTYQTVYCFSFIDLPTFTVSTSGKYTVNGLRIVAKVQVLPANYLTAFKSINTMRLISVDLVPQQWHEKAFDGVDIKYISIAELGDLVPPPKALASLGSRGLHTLFIIESSPVQLTERVFKDFPSLFYIGILNTEITRLDNNAFDGMGTLKIIWLNKVGLNNVDLSAFGGMASGFDSFVDLDDNTSFKSVTVQDPNRFPAEVSVSIKNTALENIDPTLGKLLDQKQKVTVDIGNNENLQCQKLDWMAPYVLDSKRISTTGAKCADLGGKSLNEYLESTRQQSQTSSTSTSTSTTRPTSSTSSTTSTSRPPPAQSTTTSTSTTSTSTSTKPTTKSASQASIWISLIAALSTIVIFLKP